jgi:hypothetical protein
MLSVRSGVGVLIAGLATTVALSTGTAVPARAAEPAAAAASVVADPTNLATDEDKVRAAAALGLNPGIDLLVLDDQAFVLAMWRAAEADSFVKAAALRAWESDETEAAYRFIVTGIFVAANDDARAEIVAEQAKALRRSVAVIVGLDPRDTALIEKNDRDFIIAVWERAEEGSHIQAAARAAFASGSTQQDWTAFLTTGARIAADQDLADALAQADAEEAARLRAAQLATAKRSLLQLLLLPVTEELVNAPNRQYVLHVLAEADGVEVRLAAQAALNAADTAVEQALADFIFTGGAAANTRDEQAAAAKELAGYRTRVTTIRDAARVSGFQPNLLAAADRALTDGTLLVLQTFLLKGQDEAAALDKAWVEEHRCNRAGAVYTDNQNGAALQALDLTGDCRADLGHQNTAGELHAWRGTGEIADNKLFTGAPSLVGAGWTTTSVPRIITGDFNGDFRADIISQATNGQLRAWAGTGTMADNKLFTGSGHLVGGGWTTTNIPRILTGDFNGDGKTDLIGQAANGDLRAWAATGTIADNQLFTTAASGIVGRGFTVADFPRIITGDFNGDGKTDLIGQAANGQLRAWAATGDVAENKLFTGAGQLVGGGWTTTAIPRIIVGDFNGDKKADLIGQAASGELRAWAGTGVIAENKLFLASASGLVGGGWTTTRIPRIIAGDFTGDGRTDLIGQAANGDLRAWAATGVIADNQLFTTSASGLVGGGWTLSSYPRIF